MTTAREFWIQSDGTRLYAVEEGSGPVIVMLHGGMADHRAVRPFVALLAERYRVVTPDLRGSGRSWSGAPLTFDRLAEDVVLMLDRVGAERAVVGGASGGSGVALRFALRHSDRTSGLILVKPVYAGEVRGYTEHQRAAFAAMDALASRALDEGVQVLRPLYANLPEGTRERALAMLESFDAASIVATSHFIASGAQPFASEGELSSIKLPTLLVRGDDALHPAEVSDLYAAGIPDCTVLAASTPDVAAAIADFITRLGSLRP